MNKKLQNIAFGFIGGVLLLAFLFPSEKKVYNLYERSFAAQQSTTLFFKNTRAFYYSLQDLPEAGMQVYRFGETFKIDTGTFLNFIIVHNWRADEVYIATEPSKALLALGETTVMAGDSLLTFNKTTMNNEAQYDFAAAIFLALLAEKPVTFGSDNRNLFGNTNNEKANRKVLKDYFTWVYKFR